MELKLILTDNFTIICPVDAELETYQFQSIVDSLQHVSKNSATLLSLMPIVEIQDYRTKPKEVSNVHSSDAFSHFYVKGD